MKTTVVEKVASEASKGLPGWPTGAAKVEYLLEAVAALQATVAKLTAKVASLEGAKGKPALALAA